MSDGLMSRKSGKILFAWTGNFGFGRFHCTTHRSLRIHRAVNMTMDAVPELNNARGDVVRFKCERNACTEFRIR